MPDKGPEPDPSDAMKTVKLTEQDLKDAARLFKLFADPALLGNEVHGFFPAETPANDASGRQALVSKARMVLASRLVREQYFQRDLFGEPAWEILLALYVLDDSGARFTISKLAECINAPLSTVARWVKTLEEQSLVGRVNHPTDRRIIFVRLLDKGRRALDDYLAAMPV
jgi:DNA-binding MarR family transcriptional regulator